MRILVVGSCGKKKRVQLPEAPNCDDLVSSKSLMKWKTALSHSVYPAREMYTGYQNRELVAGVDGLRSIKDVEVDMYIISAGFGVLNETTLIPPYDCSFNSLKKTEILERANSLGITEDIRSICEGDYVLLYFALSRKYMLALGGNRLSEIKGTTVTFHKQKTDSELVYVPSGANTVKSFAQRGFKIHGVVGFKGDLLRILMKYVLKKKDSYSELQSWMDPVKLKTLIYRIGGLE
jgi:hypothetical protein